MDYAGARRIGFLKKHGVAHGGFVRVPHMIVILLVLSREWMGCWGLLG